MVTLFVEGKLKLLAIIAAGPTLINLPPRSGGGFVAKDEDACACIREVKRN